MKKFEVVISAETWYPVEAETKEQAIQQALEWFAEYMPDIKITEVEDFE